MSCGYNGLLALSPLTFCLLSLRRTCSNFGCSDFVLMLDEYVSVGFFASIDFGGAFEDIL